MKFIQIEISEQSFLIFFPHLNLTFFFWAKPQEDIEMLPNITKSCVLSIRRGKKVKCFCRGFPCCRLGGKTNGTADVLYVACKRIQVATQLVHWAVLNTGVAVSSNGVHMTDVPSAARVHTSTQHTSGITARCCCMFYCPIVLNALLSNFGLKGANMNMYYYYYYYHFY